jgi:uncharacterized protein (DUF427 family)
MGLSWQQGPLGPNPSGTFLVPDPLPDHLLYAEPAGRRLRVELAGATIAVSDAVTLLHETGRYPVAYFPPADVDARLLRPSTRRTTHRELGSTSWWSLHIDGQLHRNVAWSHTSPPAHGAVMTGLIAFVWDAMDAFYEEDEQILGHAADPYHRVDVRASSRHLTARVDGQLIADSRAALVVYETGFAPRWYVPPADAYPAALDDDPLRTLCPYKGVARYYDVVAAGPPRVAAAWSYPEALPESRRLAGYLSFDLDQVDVHLDGQLLTTATHQQVVPDGTDRDLTARSD